MIELAREQGASLPSMDPDALGGLLSASGTTSLADYLAKFEATISLMQRARAVERIAYELAEDAARENVRYLEVRFSPVLNTREGLSPAEVVEAALAGLARAEREHEVRTGVIVCGIREMGPRISQELAELAVSFKGRGVVAFDLAGAELGHPAREHREAFRTVARHNMAVTVHAGEAQGPESIRQALHDCHAHRIGHGTRLREDPDLMRYVRDFRVPLEVCLTSNLQTGAVRSLAEHPLRTYFDQGLRVTLNTDNRLISGTTLTDQYWLAHTALGFTWGDLVRLTLMGFESAFLPWPEKQDLIERVRREIEALEQV